MRTSRAVAAVPAALAILFLLFTAAAAAEGESDPEKRAKLMRKGAGASAGHWALQDARELAGAKNGQSPSFEGFFQKGLDLHLAVENSVGFWRRTQRTGDETVKSYVIPNVTSIKFYPFTRPEDPLEPFLRAGVGVALGIDSVKGDPGLLGLGGGGGTSMMIGFGFHAGAGLDWRFGSSPFGASAAARYQWFRFEQDLGGADTYKGMGLQAGLTYRFQYD